MVSSWEERNDCVHEEKKRKEALVKRFTECCENREKFDCFVRDFVDNVLENANKSNADALNIDFEILVDNIKRRKSKK